VVDDGGGGEGVDEDGVSTGDGKAKSPIAVPLR